MKVHVFSQLNTGDSKDHSDPKIDNLMKKKKKKYLTN